MRDVTDLGKGIATRTRRHEADTKKMEGRGHDEASKEREEEQRVDRITGSTG
ncbi:MAG: hypothetical protein V2A58_15735 [Planctomycetota bacterium]